MKHETYQFLTKPFPPYPKIELLCDTTFRHQLGILDHLGVEFSKKRHGTKLDEEVKDVEWGSSNFIYQVFNITSWSACDSHQLTGTVRISVRGRMIGPHGILCSVTRRTPCNMLVYHSYNVSNTRNLAWTPQYALDMPWYDIEQHRTTLIHFEPLRTPSYSIGPHYHGLVHVADTSPESLRHMMSISNTVWEWYSRFQTQLGIFSTFRWHTDG